MKAPIPTETLLQGLKHYRRIARQDLLRAAETPFPEAFQVHAETRRAVYSDLEVYAAQHASDEVLAYALQLYSALPFVTGTAEDAHPDIKGRENALENFFLMVGLDPRTRREARSKRPKLGSGV